MESALSRSGYAEPQITQNTQTTADAQAALRAVLGPGFQTGLTESMLQFAAQRPVQH